MRGIRLTATIVTLLSSTVLMGCTVSSITAGASPGGYSPFLPEVRSEDSGLRQKFAATPQESHEFWSDPNRREDAHGMQLQPPEDGVSAGARDPATGTYLPATAPMPQNPQGLGTVTSAEVYDRSGLGASTFGRLYFAFTDGTTYGCSATVVNSTSGSIVATAAHCVTKTDGSGALAQSVVFIPADRNYGAEEPYGAWAAVEMAVPQKFIDNARTTQDGMLLSSNGWNYDFAFLKMEKQNGKTIQEVTGAQGIAFGIPVDGLTQIGYPADPPYNGTEEYVCASTDLSPSWQGGYSHTCSMTRGASGGAWLSNYDTASGTGYLVGVTSTVDDSGSGLTTATVLGQTALDLYTNLDQG